MQVRIEINVGFTEDKINYYCITYTISRLFDLILCRQR